MIENCISIIKPLNSLVLFGIDMQVNWLDSKE